MTQTTTSHDDYNRGICPVYIQDVGIVLISASDSAQQGSAD